MIRIRMRTLLPVAAVAFAAPALAQNQTEDPGARYAQAVADTESFQRFNRQLEEQVRSQEEEIASIERQLSGLNQLPQFLRHRLNYSTSLVSGDCGLWHVRPADAVILIPPPLHPLGPAGPGPGRGVGAVQGAATGEGERGLPRP